MSVPFFGASTPPSVTDPATPDEQRVAAELHQQRRAAVRRLSDRQLEVALAFARAPHISPVQVGAQQYVSMNTIKTQLQQVYRALEVNRRRHLPEWLPLLTEEGRRRRDLARGREVR